MWLLTNKKQLVLNSDIVLYKVFAVRLALYVLSTYLIQIIYKYTESYKAQKKALQFGTQYFLPVCGDPEDPSLSMIIQPFLYPHNNTMVLSIFGYFPPLVFMKDPEAKIHCVCFIPMVYQSHYLKKENRLVQHCLFLVNPQWLQQNFAKYLQTINYFRICQVTMTS